MRNPEQGPAIPEPSSPEVPSDIEILGEKEEGDKEYKDKVMRGLYEDKLQCSRELGALQEAYKEEKNSGKLTQAREKEYQRKIDSLRKAIVQTAKLKDRAQRQFEDYEKRMAA